MEHGVDETVETVSTLRSHGQQRLGITGRRRLLRCRLQGLDRADHRRQRRAQFMAHGGDEIVLDGLHGVPLRDITCKQRETPPAVFKQILAAAIATQFNYCGLNEYFASIGGQRNVFKPGPVARHGAAAQVLAQIALQGFALRRRCQLGDVHTAQHRRVVAEQFQRRRIGEADGSHMVKNNDGVHGGVPDRAIQRGASLIALTLFSLDGRHPGEDGRHGGEKAPLHKVGAPRQCRAIPPRRDEDRDGVARQHIARQHQHQTPAKTECCEYQNGEQQEGEGRTRRPGVRHHIGRDRHPASDLRQRQTGIRKAFVKAGLKRNAKHHQTAERQHCSEHQYATADEAREVAREVQGERHGSGGRGDRKIAQAQRTRIICTTQRARHRQGSVGERHAACGRLGCLLGTRTSAWRIASSCGDLRCTGGRIHGARSRSRHASGRWGCAHSSSPRMCLTGAKLRRCAGQAPCSRMRARCSCVA